MPKAKTASEIVAKSNKSRGITPVGLRLSPEEISLLDEMAANHGGRKGAVVAGLISLKGGQAAESQVLAGMLRKLADEIDPK